MRRERSSFLVFDLNRDIRAQELAVAIIIAAPIPGPPGRNNNLADVWTNEIIHCGRKFGSTM